MDDFNLSTLTDSKNEWCARLTNILTPCIIDGTKSIFDEAYNLCIENDEEEKYLMTFQNLLNNIPKWSSQTVSQEKDRIIASSCCNYLDDLLTCVHITQLKSLTSSRVGIKQKKVNISIPNIDSFIHKVYINVARKVYVNVYLFERDIMPLQIQKNNRELELIVKECILNSIRENIPVEELLKTYLDETQETEVEVEETREQVLDEEAIKRLEKEAKEKELESIKKEVRDKIKKESKENLSTALKEANRSLNEATKSRDTTAPLATVESVSESEGTDYTTDEESNHSSDKLVIEDKQFGSSKDIDSNLNLDIKNLDDDPDKLNLEILDLDFETEKASGDKIDDLDFDLGIKELS